MKLTITNIILLTILFSCSNNEQNEPVDNLPKRSFQSPVSKYRKIPDDSLIHYAFRPKNSEIIVYETNFQTLEDFPSSWAGLSKNALGLFIYHRNQKLARVLTVTNDTLTNSGYGEAVSWPIREFKKLNDHTYYFGLGGDTTSSTYARCTVQVLDVDTIYSVQSTEVYVIEEGEEKLLGHYRGLYIPIYKQHLFYHIDEPNRNDPEAWIPTEEIDLDKFKEEKAGYNTTYQQ